MLEVYLQKLGLVSLFIYIYIYIYIYSKNTNHFIDLPILKYILILSLNLQQPSLYIYNIMINEYILVFIYI